MRKQLREIFDQTKPEELETLVQEHNVPQLSEEIYESIKEKVYKKTGIASKKLGIFNFHLKRYEAMAACALLCAVIGIFAYMWWKVPVWEDARYTASQIAGMFEGKMDGVTNAYTKIYVPNEQYLYIGELPDSEYLNVYRYKYKQQTLDKKTFETFIDSFLDRAVSSLNCRPTSYIIEELNYGSGKKELSVYEKIGKHTFSASQTVTQMSVALINRDQGLSLDGEMVEVDQRMSDAEILNSVQSIKEKLFHIFGVSFRDVKIVREYGENGENGVDYLTIYFYNVTAHELNRTQEQPVSDYISIVFDNFKNYQNDMVSDGILKDATIRYVKNHKNTSQIYKMIAKAKRISLEEAERLLLKGYVFGGHSCSICMSGQQKVSFEDYDFVDIEYVFGYSAKNNQLTEGIPFYAFYKKIGTDAKGQTIYAKTYVPAIKVKGYEEYFEKQVQNHRGFWEIK